MPKMKTPKSIPKELTTPIIAPKYLVNALLEQGPNVQEGEMVDKYWDWCLAEQKRRFDIFLEYMRYPSLQNDASDFLCFRWRRLAKQLAEDCFVGLRLPTPYRRGRSPEWKKLLDEVASEHAKAAPEPITDSEALRRAVANEANAWMARKVDTNLRRRFQAAKKRLFKEQSIAPREPAAWWQLMEKIGAK
jgi:hypothetical protein